MGSNTKRILTITIVISVVVGSIFGGVAGFWMSVVYLNNKDAAGWFTDKMTPEKRRSSTEEPDKVVKVEEQSAVTEAVERVSPAVVSIAITKELPVLRRGPSSFEERFFQRFFGGPQYRQEGTEEQKVGGGTGFIVSPDGYIVTNKHVVSDMNANYTVVLNSEEEYQAEVLTRDSTTDIAILKIDGEDLPTVDLGNSSDLQLGQKVIAIGNALGEFRNTVTTGVVSGLSRSITAGGAGTAVEKLSGLIQTDASINPGNSGGPLLSIEGKVIGVNTAMAQGAENIGFAIPVNEIKESVSDVKEHGRIIRAWLGVRYVILGKNMAETNNLPVEHGALIVRGDTRTELAVVPGSPAAQAGLQAHDIILEVDGEKINQDHTLSDAIHEHDPGDKIAMKIWRDGEEKEIEVELGERNKED